MEKRRSVSQFGTDQRGTALVEFALVFPMLVVLLVGMLGWGAYFWMAHSVQQVANDAARAAVAGLNAAERTQLARAAAAEDVVDYAGLDPGKLTTTVLDRGDRAVISVSYDASASPIFAFAGITPMPSSLITRQAAVRLGGY